MWYDNIIILGFQRFRSNLEHSTYFNQDKIISTLLICKLITRVSQSFYNILLMQSTI